LSADAMRDARSEPENRLSHTRRPVASETRKAVDMMRRNPRTRLARFAQTGPLGRHGAFSLRTA